MHSVQRGGTARVNPSAQAAHTVWPQERIAGPHWPLYDVNKSLQVGQVGEEVKEKRAAIQTSFVRKA